MKYFRIKKELDQSRLYKNGRYLGFLISGELKTAKELEKLGVDTNKEGIEEVEIKKYNTFWMFGARFMKTLTAR